LVCCDAGLAEAVTDDDKLNMDPDLHRDDMSKAQSPFPASIIWWEPDRGSIYKENQKKKDIFLIAPYLASAWKFTF
jgi:hypothetical protein